MKNEQLKELLLQSLEHEAGGVQVYATALECAVDSDLKKEWTRYHEQTQKHVRVLEQVLRQLGLEREATPGCEIVRDLGVALVTAMQKAAGAGKPEAAQLVACECVVLAETRDHLDWELIGEAARKLKGKEREALQAAYDEIEDEEDEHLYHTKGWCRELWLDSLGIPAVLPPPEERKHVKTAIGASRAEQSRKSMS